MGRSLCSSSLACWNLSWSVIASPLEGTSGQQLAQALPVWWGKASTQSLMLVISVLHWLLRRSWPKETWGRGPLHPTYSKGGTAVILYLTLLSWALGVPGLGLDTALGRTLFGRFPGLFSQTSGFNEFTKPFCTWIFMFAFVYISPSISFG